MQTSQEDLKTIVYQTVERQTGLITGKLESKELILCDYVTKRRSQTFSTFELFPRWSYLHLSCFKVALAICNRPFSKLAAKNSNKSKLKTYTSTRKNILTLVTLKSFSISGVISAEKK